MTRSDYFRPVRGGISGLCEEADDNPLSLDRVYVLIITVVRFVPAVGHDVSTLL